MSAERLLLIKEQSEVELELLEHPAESVESAVVVVLLEPAGSVGSAELAESLVLVVLLVKAASQGSAESVELVVTSD